MVVSRVCRAGALRRSLEVRGLRSGAIDLRTPNSDRAGVGSRLRAPGQEADNTMATTTPRDSAATRFPDARDSRIPSRRATNRKI